MKPFNKLRTRLFEQGCTHYYAAHLIGRCENYFTCRMQGKKPWDMQDVHRLMKVLYIPPEEMHEYFPPDHEKRGRKAG